MTLRTTRRGFTLLETMLAAAIGALVVLACLGMMFMMNRTDRALDARATEQAELERLRWVMERTFSRLLMSDEPHTPRPGDLNVASPVDDIQANLKDNKAGVGAAGQADPSGGAAAGDRFGSDKSGGGRFTSTTTGGSGGSGTPGGSSGGRFTSDGQGGGRFASDAGPNGAKGAAGTDQPDDPKNKNQRPPPPPRMVLAADTTAPAGMIHRLAPGDPPQDAGSPQRLEVVLFDSPVPTDSGDPVERALAAPKSKSSRGKSFRADPSDPRAPAAGAAGTAAAGTSAAGTAADQQDEVDVMSMPARAVRGAFEVRPQPRKNGEVPGGQVSTVGLQTEATGLWQIWWVPLPRIGSDGTVEVLPGSDPAQGDPVSRQYLIASNLRYVKWTVFQGRQRKDELTSIWSGDLPAYVELEVETAASLRVNWMFEIDWAVGPEVPHKSSTAGGAANGKSDTTGGSRFDQPAADTSGGGAKGGK